MSTEAFETLNSAFTAGALKEALKEALTGLYYINKWGFVKCLISK